MEQKNLAIALVAFHKEASGLVPFDSENPYFKSRYSSLGAIINHINKHAPKHGLSWVQFPVTGYEGMRIGVKTIILHESGESLESDFTIAFVGTKNPAQEAGAIITYLRRYGLAAAFGLYADEDNDANPAETEAEMVVMKPAVKAEAKGKPAQKAEAKPKPARPYESDVLIENLKKMAGKSKPCTQKDRQTLVAAITQLLETDDPDLRHEMQLVLFGARSIAEVAPEMVSAALAWLNPVWDKEAKVYLFGEYVVDEFDKVREDYAI